MHQTLRHRLALGYLRSACGMETPLELQLPVPAFLHALANETRVQKSINTVQTRGLHIGGIMELDYNHRSTETIIGVLASVIVCLLSLSAAVLRLGPYPSSTHTVSIKCEITQCWNHDQSDAAIVDVIACPFCVYCAVYVVQILRSVHGIQRELGFALHVRPPPQPIAVMQHKS